MSIFWCSKLTCTNCFENSNKDWYYNLTIKKTTLSSKLKCQALILKSNLNPRTLFQPVLMADQRYSHMGLPAMQYWCSRGQSVSFLWLPVALICTISFFLNKYSILLGGIIKMSQQKLQTGSESRLAALLTPTDIYHPKPATSKLSAMATHW